jgi:16S rRNA (adenine1518-N6/adenine1519-N6)-dimethyltransferase
MPETPGYPSTQELLKKFHGLLESNGTRLKKSLGQHLLSSDGMLRKIARLCEIKPETLVIEIGAGIANLTHALLSYSPGKYVGIELDKRFAPLHSHYFKSDPNLRFIYADAMKVDFDEIIDKSHDVVIAGNIPYQVTSPLIMKILTGHFPWRKIVFTIQKEVAERLTAKPGNRTIGGITIKSRLFASAHIAFSIPPRHFIPPPKVESSVIVLTPHETPLLPAEQQPDFFRLVDAAFSMRRKTLLNCLGRAYSGKFKKDEMKQILESTGINPTQRAETLDINDFLALHHKIRNH